MSYRYLLFCTLKLDSQQGLVNMCDAFELRQCVLPRSDTKPNMEHRTDVDWTY